MGLGPGRGGGGHTGEEGWGEGQAWRCRRIPLRLTSSAGAGSAHLASEPMTPVSGTTYGTFSTGRECAPSPWAAATPWSVGPAPSGAWGQGQSPPGLSPGATSAAPRAGPPSPLEVPSRASQVHQPDTEASELQSWVSRHWGFSGRSSSWE